MIKTNYSITTNGDSYVAVTGNKNIHATVEE